MGMPASPQITTIEQFFALPEDHGRRHELLDGVYVVTPRGRLVHQRAEMALGLRLLPVLASRPHLELFSVPGDIVLGERTVVEPDLFVIPRPPSSDIHWRDVGRPLLVVEILSRSTAHRDRGVKRHLYQQAGVPEYWIVNLEARLVERWRPNDERPEVCTATLSWKPDEMGEPLNLDLREFFEAVLDR